MFVQVRLLKGFSKTLTYKVPDDISDENLVGKIVRVPIRNHESVAIVVDQHEILSEKSSFKIREIKAVEKFPQDYNYKNFIEKLSDYYQIDSIHFLKRIRSFLLKSSTRNTLSSELFGKNGKETHETAINIANITLTKEQQQVVNFLSKYIVNQTYQPIVLHGVTGSGKTEIYKNRVSFGYFFLKLAVFF